MNGAFNSSESPNAGTSSQDKGRRDVLFVTYEMQKSNGDSFTTLLTVMAFVALHSEERHVATSMFIPQSLD